MKTFRYLALLLILFVGPEVTLAQQWDLRMAAIQSSVDFSYSDGTTPPRNDGPFDITNLRSDLALSLMASVDSASYVGIARHP